MKHLRVKQAQSGQRLDIAAADWLGLTRSQTAKAIRNSQILLNHHAVKPGEILQTGDRIDYTPPKPTEAKLDLPVIYEDADLMVIDKPAGLMVHPTGASTKQPTLADFARRISLDPDKARPGIVHRLDKDTSGLIIVAKTAAAKDFLQRQFAGRKVEKEYIALVEGHLPKDSATINLPIGPGSGIRRRVDPTGRLAATRYEVTRRFSRVTLVNAWPQTGRTHQLRVHFAAIGHPIVGDNLYGRSSQPLGRQFLHAHRLGFTSPSGKYVEVTSKLPKDLKDYLERLE